MPLPITATTAALLALLLLFLAIQTVRTRLRAHIPFGDGGNQEIVVAIRSHGNLAEHAPIVLIMLGLLENAGAGGDSLALIAGSFVIGRIFHVVGLHQKHMPGKAPLLRQLGVIITWLTMVILAGLLLVGVFAT